MFSFIKKFLVCLIIIAFIACNKSGKNEKTINSKNSLESSMAYLNPILSKRKLETFFIENNEIDSIQNLVFDYYKERGNRLIWFDVNGIKPATKIFYNRLETNNIKVSKGFFYNAILDSLVFNKGKLKTINKKNLFYFQKLDFLLSISYFKNSSILFDELKHKLLSSDSDENEKFSFILLDSLLLNPLSNIFNDPRNRFFSKLNNYLFKYENIVKNTEMPHLPNFENDILIGDKNLRIKPIKRLLFILEDLGTLDTTDIFNISLMRAVNSFQKRNGLPIFNGINQLTYEQLLIPLEQRIAQIKVNLDRLRILPVLQSTKFVVVNIPDFKLNVFNDEKFLWSLNVVVGKDITPTYLINSKFTHIILNPFWEIPNKLVIDEILPEIKRNPNYISDNNMEILSGSKIVLSKRIKWEKYSTSIPYRIRQKPGKNNSLGKMKFVFPNHHLIYLHDTPSKYLFQNNTRAFSHGCIRVSNPKKLAFFLLAKNLSTDSLQFNKDLLKNKTVDIKLKQAIPIYLVYFTAWVDGRNKLNFRKDIYGLDKQ